MLDTFIYKEEEYLLIDLERCLKQPIDGIESTEEGYVKLGGISIDFIEEEGLDLDDITEGEGLISPEDYGMKPSPMDVSYRYSYSTYEITDKGLFLKQMTVGKVADGHKPIQGIMPILEHNSYDNFVYKKLNIFTPLTGRVLLCKGLISSFISCGIIDNIACETLLRMSFKKGELILIQDLSVGNEIERRIEIQRQQNTGLKGLIEGVKPMELLPSTDSL